MLPRFNSVLIDRAVIATRLRLHPDLFDDTNAFIRDRNLQIRTAKSSRRRSGRGRKLTLDVLAYKGIKVEISKRDDGPYAHVKIHFNPGVCLHGQNARTLVLSEFLDALALLVSSLTPLLQHQKDWLDIVPGVRSGGVAHWTYLELPFQCLDPDGSLLDRFRHLRHPRILTPTRQWEDSLTAGGHRSSLVLHIYRKAIEMANRKKLAEANMPIFKNVLRFEARLKGKKLVAYLGNTGNTEIIDGKPRLVRFYPHDLVHAHRTIFGELTGVYRDSSCACRDAEATHAKLKGLAAMGAMLAHIALDKRVGHSLPQLASLLAFYTKAKPKSINLIVKAGLEELSRRSPICAGSLFSDAAYESRCGIASELVEKKVNHRIADMLPNVLIRSTYSPPDQPLDWLSDYPRYLA